MKKPPLLMYLKIHDNTKDAGKGFGLWIPLFLFAPIFLVLLLAIFILAIPFLLIALLFTWHMWWWRIIWNSPPAILNVLHSLPGTLIQINDKNALIDISIH